MREKVGYRDSPQSKKPAYGNGKNKFDEEVFSVPSLLSQGQTHNTHYSQGVGRVLKHFWSVNICFLFPIFKVAGAYLKWVPSKKKEKKTLVDGSCFYSI